MQSVVLYRAYNLVIYMLECVIALIVQCSICKNSLLLNTSRHGTARHGRFISGAVSGRSPRSSTASAAHASLSTYVCASTWHSLVHPHGTLSCLHVSVFHASISLSHASTWHSLMPHVALLCLHVALYVTLSHASTCHSHASACHALMLPRVMSAVRLSRRSPQREVRAAKEGYWPGYAAPTTLQLNTERYGIYANCPVYV